MPCQSVIFTYETNLCVCNALIKQHGWAMKIVRDKGINEKIQANDERRVDIMGNLSSNVFLSISWFYNKFVLK